MDGYERRCWTCDEVMCLMVADGVRRLVCPSCGPKARRGRNRTDSRMRAQRTGPPAKIA